MLALENYEVTMITFNDLQGTKVVGQPTNMIFLYVLWISWDIPVNHHIMIFLITTVSHL